MNVIVAVLYRLFSKRHPVVMALLVALFFIAMPHSAHAVICTDDSGGGGGGGGDDNFDIGDLHIFRDINRLVDQKLSSLSTSMFGDVAGYLSGMIYKLCLLYIVIYGCLFMFGSAQTSLYDGVARMAKLFMVSAVINNGGLLLGLMNDIFQRGTDEIVSAIITKMYNGDYDSGDPMAAIDALLTIVASPKTLVTIEALASTGIYGFMFFIVTLNSLKSITEAVVNALWVYLMSKVVRCLLIGVSPVFIPCFLFKGTRQFFQGWLNQMVNTCLQPILLFAFFTFFVSTMKDVIDTITKDHPVCANTMPDTGRSAPVTSEWWSFKANDDDDGETHTVWGPDGSNYEDPTGGGGGSGSDKKFPINVYSIIVLFVLAEIGVRLNGIVLAIASGIAGASTSFGDMSSVFSGSSQKVGGAPQKAEDDHKKQPPATGGGGKDNSRTAEGVRDQIRNGWLGMRKKLKELE